MIIKKGQKYYLVEREMTQAEVDKAKAMVAANHNAIDEQLEKQIKDLRDRAKARKSKMRAELDELETL